MPTYKQFKAMELLAQTKGNVKKAMKLAGYSERSADQAILLRSPELKTLADSIPDSLVNEKHLELLKRNQIFVSRNKDDVVEITDTGVGDVQAMRYGLDMAYKLKGSYAPEKIKHSGDIKFGRIEELSNEELQRLAEETPGA